MMMMNGFDCTSCVGLVSGCALGAAVVVVFARGSVGVVIFCVEVIACVACAEENACAGANVYLFLLFGNLDLDSSSIDVAVNAGNRSDAHENPAQNQFGILIWVYQQF